MATVLERSLIFRREDNLDNLAARELFDSVSHSLRDEIAGWIGLPADEPVTMSEWPEANWT